MKSYKVLAALLLAGSVFCFGGFSAGKVKKGVAVNGVDVGGMSFSAAAEAVRAQIKGELAPFTVHTPAGGRAFSLDFSDNLSELLPRAKRNGSYEAEITLRWADAEEELLSLCEEFSSEAEDASLSFSAAGFSYRKEKMGTYCEYGALLSDVWKALAEGKGEAELSVKEYLPAVTEELLRERTRVLSSFSTRYDGGNRSRSHNIALAASRIAGTVILPGEEFSFNEAAGKRTAANGYRKAPVISGGTFVQDYGGGVCQASTTLMNAALSSGMRITESHSHSLAVGYIPPSLDAMVSSSSDLKFVNPYPYPVYVQGRAGDGKVIFTLYGMPDGREYRTESRVLLRVDPPPEKLVEGEEDRILRAAKQGVASESYLLVYENGTLLSRTLLRRDTYAAVQGIREVKRPAEPSPSP